MPENNPAMWAGDRQTESPLNAPKGLKMSTGASSYLTIHVTETPSSLILQVDANVQTELRDRRAELNADGSDAFSSDDTLYDTFEWLTCNTEFEFVQPEQTGDLTSAPLLGIRDEQGNVIRRWGFMAYERRSPQDDLADTGRYEFVG